MGNLLKRLGGGGSSSGGGKLMRLINEVAQKKEGVDATPASPEAMAIFNKAGSRLPSSASWATIRGAGVTTPQASGIAPLRGGQITLDEPAPAAVAEAPALSDTSLEAKKRRFGIGL